MDDYHLGWRVDLDKNMAASKCFATAAMIGNNGNYYLRANLLSKFIGVGTWWKSDKGEHSLEAQYDVSNGEPGIAGQPLYMRYGGKYKLGCCDYKCHVLLKDKLLWKDVMAFPVTDSFKANLTVLTDVQ